MSDNNQNLPANVPQQQVSQEVYDKMKEQSLGFFNPAVWAGMNQMAQVFHNSGALPKGIDSTAKVIMVLQAGKEAGLQPLEAINSYYFVNGKVALYGDMAISQVIKAGHKVEWGKCDATSATVKITRGDNGASNTVTFTMQEAINKGLTVDNFGKPKAPWQKFPENMLRFKAFHSCARFTVPDALHGVPIKEVLEAEEVVEAQVVERPASAPKAQPAKMPDPVMPEAMPSLEQAVNAPAPVEEMPAKPAAPKKSRGQEVLDKARQKKSDEAGTWPEDVCRLVRFIADIRDEDLSEDMIQLKKDAISGVFKGYDAYPTIQQNLASLPEDFQ